MLSRLSFSLLFVVFASHLAACPSAPVQTGPCMTDQECRSGRICHEGRCRFLEEVQRDLDREQLATLPAVSDAGLVATDTSGLLQDSGTVARPESSTSGSGTGSGAGLSMFMGDSRHTGRLPFDGPLAAVTPAWTYRTGSRIYASPVIAPHGDIMVGSLDQSLTSVTPDGALRFRYSGTGKYYGSAVVTPAGDVIAGSLDGSLVALSPEGQVRWQQKLSDGIDASPVLADDGRLYVAADGIYAFDLKGVLQWHYAVGVHVRSTPAVHPRGLVVFGTPNGKLLALHLDGTLAWEADTFANVDGGAAISDDGRIVLGNDLGHVLCYDAQGKLLWRFNTGDDVRATPAITADGTTLVGSYDRAMYAIGANGALKWRYATAGRIRSSARIDRAGRIYFGSQDDFIYGLDPNGQLLFRHNLGRDVDSSPVIDSHGTLLVGADDGSLYALR
ncbi:MAG: cell surface protein [Myxococcaceae bacterium]|nr:cell surface protein [Myxococcaceae bacterium]